MFSRRAASVVGVLAILALVRFSAAATVLDFEGLQNLEPIDNFYNGGLGGFGSGPGPNYGITFSNNSLALIDQGSGGTGVQSNEPSPPTVAFFLSGSAATMNVPAGFDTGFSFYYSAFVNGSVTVFDGLNGTGNVLATLNLPANGAPNTFTPVGVSFAGTAMSVDFSGSANLVAFDNITLGASVPVAPSAVPVPQAAWGGLVLLGALLVRRKLQSA